MAEKIVEREEYLSPNPLFPFRMGAWGVGQLETRILSPDHNHAHSELIFCMEGNCIVEINGIEHRIDRNEMIFIGKDLTHCTRSDDPQSLIFVLFFTPEFVEIPFNSSIERKYIKAFLDMFLVENHFTIVKDDAELTIRNYLSYIQTEYLSNLMGHELSIKGWFYQIICHILRNKDEFVQKIEKSKKSGIEKAIAYIDDHFNEDINIELLANMCNFSYHYFCKTFKKTMGKSFKQYLDFLRVAEAEKIMITQDLSISEVAYKVGFCDQGTFYRLYKRVRGYPPTEFKKKLKY